MINKVTLYSQPFCVKYVFGTFSKIEKNIVQFEDIDLVKFKLTNIIQNLCNDVSLKCDSIQYESNVQIPGTQLFGQQCLFF